MGGAEFPSVASARIIRRLQRPVEWPPPGVAAGGGSVEEGGCRNLALSPKLQRKTERFYTKCTLHYTNALYMYIQADTYDVGYI